MGRPMRLFGSLFSVIVTIFEMLGTVSLIPVAAIVAFAGLVFVGAGLGIADADEVTVTVNGAELAVLLHPVSPSRAATVASGRATGRR